jgi:hypothetical protein
MVLIEQVAGIFKKDGTGFIFPTEIVGGEVLPNIAQSCRTKQSIDYGVDDRIGI